MMCRSQPELLPSRWPLRLLALPALLTLALAGLAEPTDAQQDSPRPFLFKDARGELAAARAEGESEVLLIIASTRGENPRAAELVEEKGGSVGYRADDVDYLRARLPVGDVDDLAGHEAVHSVEVSIVDTPRTLMQAGGTGNAPEGAGDPSPAPTPPPGGRSAPPADTTEAEDDGTVEPAWPPKLSDYPLSHPYDPVDDIGAREFLEDNPEYDGRGVVMALIDGHPDPLVPELQTALTLDGEPTDKFPVFKTVVDPEEEEDGRWIDMSEEVVARDGEFTVQDSTYTAPEDGAFRFGLLDEVEYDSLMGEGLDEDLNRDGNPEGSSRLYGILWDRDEGEVRVDTRQNLDFTDEEPLRDYREEPRFGVFGEDDPDTEIRESVGFAIQIDEERENVAVNAGVARHGSLVIGAAAASRGSESEGRFEGVAPGMGVAAIAQGASAYGQTEAVIEALRNPEVDGAILEQHSTITRSYLLRDGRLVPTVIYTRLIEEYDKPIFVPTHNYPILGGTDDFVLARHAIGVGGHESRDNYLANHALHVEHQDDLLITGGYGPMGDGSLTPDVISPSNHLSTGRGFLEGTRFDGVYQLPPGYTIAGGTSTATPTAAAAGALLISAARQEGVAHDARRLEHAIASSARWVPHLAAYQQGNGVVDVAAAWQILQALDEDDDALVDIEVRAPVRHPYSHLLPEPHEGVGLFERDGWAVGDREERTVHLRRTSGPEGDMTFTLSWEGNDGETFRAPSTVTLPLDEEVDLPIQVEPREPGAHTAHLTLENPDVPGYAHRILHTVVAPAELNEDGDFRATKETEVPRPGMRSHFVRVPEGASALRVDLDAPEREVDMALVRPETRAAATEVTGDDGPGSSTHVVENPMPGVWEIRLRDAADTQEYDWDRYSEDEPVPPTPSTIEASVIGQDIEGEPPGTGSENPVELGIHNRMADVKAGAASLAMGGVRRAHETIDEREQHVHKLEVPRGSELLLIRTHEVEHPDADLDIYVFDCSEKEEDGGDEACEPARVDADPGSEQTVLVRDPAAGSWRVVVDASQISEGETEYQYEAVVFNPSFGHVPVTDIREDRTQGERWTTTAAPWVAERLEESEEWTPFPALLLEGVGEEGSTFPIAVEPLPY